VLAGGAGRRLGRAKGELTVGGKTLARRAADALAPVCRAVMISVAPGASNPAPGYACVEDARPRGRGPLAGIAAGFAAAGDGDLLVLACDYPRVETPLLRVLVGAGGRGEALVLIRDGQGRDHPLVACWRRSAEPRVNRALQSLSLRVGDLVDSLPVERIGPAELVGIKLEEALININYPQDLERLSGPSGSAN
jgi:molybdopterin-guanine dinucleotide biosynthesis protein A